MAQSKKEKLKKICRECRRLDPQLRRRATQIEFDLIRGDIEFDLIQSEATGLLWDLQYGHLVRYGTLERLRDFCSPVTSQQVVSLYERWRTFSQQVLSAL